MGTAVRMGVFVAALVGAAGTNTVCGQSPQGGPEGLPRLLTSLVDPPPYQQESQIFDMQAVAVFGDRVIMIADDMWTSGREIWISDGTLAGTRPFVELDPRPCLDISPIAIRSFGDGTFAVIGERGKIAISDGTAAGTHVSPETVQGGEILGKVNGKVLHLGAMPTRLGSGAEYRKLWASDGTPEGTREIASIPGMSLSPAGGVIAGRFVYFWEIQGARATLWRSDGTAEGTVRLPGFVRDRRQSALATVWTGDEIFAIIGIANRWELRATRGTPNDERVIELPAGVSVHQDSTIFAGPDGRTVIFSTTDGLYQTDGTVGGTSRLAAGVMSVDINNADFGAIGTIDSPAGRVTMFFGHTAAEGRAIWSMDGTTAGTRLIYAGVAGPTGLSAALLAVGRDAAWFRTGEGICRNDGTEGGMSTAVPVGSRSSNLVMIGGPYVAAAGSSLFFVPNSQWYALSVIDGPARQARTLVVPNVPKPTGCNPLGVATLGNKSLFAVKNQNYQTVLYGTDGTPQGTSVIKSLTTGGFQTYRSPITRIGSLAWLASGDQSRPTIWRTDGTNAGTYEVGTVSRSPQSIPYDSPMVPGASGMLLAMSGVYTSDGTRNSLRSVSGPLTDNLNDLGVDAQGRIYTFGRNYTDCPIMVTNLATRRSIAVANFTRTLGETVNFLPVEGGMAFTIHYSSTQPELWFSDGTAEGTRMLVRFTGSDVDELIEPKAVANGRIIFCQPVPHGRVLWSVDPASGDAVELARTPRIRGLTNFQNSAMMLITTPESGCEPWITDGTVAGTRMITETIPGPEGIPDDSMPMTRTTSPIEVVENRAYFAAATRELAPHAWVSDGTAEGTHPFGRRPEDLSTLPLYPQRFARNGGRIIYAGFTADRAFEMYAVSLCAADLNGDDAVDLEDLGQYLDTFSQGGTIADQNGDGFADFFDYLEFMASLENGC